MKAPFCDKLSGMICTKFLGRDMVYTLRVKFQDNQGVVQFRNGGNETAQLRKNKAAGILDLRSIGYFKVGYQKMVNMAESSKTFNPFNTIGSSALPWPNLTPLHTLEAHNSAGNGFTSLKPSAFNRKLNFEKKQFSFLLASPQSPLRGD